MPRIVEVDGTSKAPVQHVVITNITFMYAAWIVVRKIVLEDY
jgi:hypothetical protein